jgi:hypothetical protein
MKMHILFVSKIYGIKKLEKQKIIEVNVALDDKIYNSMETLFIIFLFSLHNMEA